jgi:hypothetical protein
VGVRATSVVCTMPWTTTRVPGGGNCCRAAGVLGCCAGVVGATIGGGSGGSFVTVVSAVLGTSGSCKLSTSSGTIATRSSTCSSSSAFNPSSPAATGLEPDGASALSSGHPRSCCNSSSVSGRSGCLPFSERGVDGPAVAEEEDKSVADNNDAGRVGLKSRGGALDQRRHDLLEFSGFVAVLPTRLRGLRRLRTLLRTEERWEAVVPFSTGVAVLSECVSSVLAPAAALVMAVLVIAVCCCVATSFCGERRSLEVFWPIRAVTEKWAIG